MATISTSQDLANIKIPSKICGIYKIVNKLNRKVYIGQSVDIRRRWLAHNNWKNRTASAIGRAIIKYGVENFDYIIIEECDRDMLNEREKYWILKTNTIAPIGYNLSSGGDSNYYCSEESKRKMSLAQTGKKRSIAAIEKFKKTMSEIGWCHPIEEHKIALSKAASLRNKNHPEYITKMNEARLGLPSWNKGKKLPKEQVEKMRLKKIGVPAVWRNKAIQRNDGIVFASITSASIQMGVNRASIHKVLKGTRKTLLGYVFDYVERGAYVCN